MSIDLHRSSFGFYGMKEVDATNTVATTIAFNALQALEDTTVSFTSNGRGSNNQSTFTSIVIPSGSIIFGDFTSVAVSAGKLIGYLKG
jgi:hypothetical protein